MTPERLNPANIEDFLRALRCLLMDHYRAGHDLRISQVLGNLGDHYNMEDADFVRLVWEACD